MSHLPKIIINDRKNKTLTNFDTRLGPEKLLQNTLKYLITW